MALSETKHELTNTLTIESLHLFPAAENFCSAEIRSVEMRVPIIQKPRNLPLSDQTDDISHNLSMPRCAPNYELSVVFAGAQVSITFLLPELPYMRAKRL